MPVLTYSLILLLGSIAGFLLYKKIPNINHHDQVFNDYQAINVSIIIPARNEEKNIKLILSDLRNQTYKIHEIICVDDNSTDNTSDVIKLFHITNVKIVEKPKDWSGKTWACQMGAKKSSGDLLIFIDADVRVKPDTIEKLVIEYLKNRKVISVQPYHTVDRFFEQFAFFFNVIGVGANGAAFPYSNKKAGLFGPVIVMSRETFQRIDGFYNVRNSVIEDVELGSVLTQNNLQFQLFIGDKSLSFQMYDNFKELFLGFLKNYASGASKTPLLLLILTFWWIQSITAYPILVFISLINQTENVLIFGIIMYIITVLHLIVVGEKIGSFKKRYIMFYPILLVIFHFVFIYSSVLKILGKKVKWKGRDISLKK